MTFAKLWHIDHYRGAWSEATDFRKTVYHGCELRTFGIGWPKVSILSDKICYSNHRHDCVEKVPSNDSGHRFTRNIELSPNISVKRRKGWMYMASLNMQKPLLAAINGAARTIMTSVTAAAGSRRHTSHKVAAMVITLNTAATAIAAAIGASPV